jgi:hypothetical protein
MQRQERTTRMMIAFQDKHLTYILSHMLTALLNMEVLSEQTIRRSHASITSLRLVIFFLSIGIIDKQFSAFTVIYFTYMMKFMVL